MATIIYRKLDDNYEPLFGQSQANFISDNEAVAQAILTRLKLFMGEWWEDLNDGLPLWQAILGHSAKQPPVNLAIQQRIVLTPYVITMDAVNSSYQSDTRGYQFSASVATQFGQVQVSNIPTPPGQGL